MPIPNEQIVRLGPGELERLANAIRAEVEEHEARTALHVRALALAHQFYELDAPEKNFPWRGAANTNFPIVTTAVDTFKAKIKQTIFESQPELWIAKPIPRGGQPIDTEPVEGLGVLSGKEVTWADVASAATDFCNRISDDDVAGLNLRDVFDDWIDIMTKEGTAPLKIMVEERQIAQRVRTDENQLVTQFVPRPAVVFIPLSTSECVWSADSPDMDKMWLFGHRLILTDQALRRKGREFRYNRAALREALNSPEQFTDPLEEARARLEKLQIISHEAHRVYVLSVEWMRENSSKVENWIVTWHRGSNRILRVIEQPLWVLGMKGYEVARFERRGRRFLGRRQPENLIPLNRAINTALNQAFDAQSAANAAMLKVKYGSRAEDDLEADGVRPGGWLRYDNDPNEVVAFNLNQPVTLNTVQLVSLFMQFIERVGRTTDASIGRVESAKRTPASTSLTILQEGATLPDEIIGRLRTVAGRAMIQLMHLYNQIRPEIFTEVLGAERGTVLRKALTTPEFPLSTYIRVTLKAVSSTRSKAAEHQRLLSNLQVLFGFYQQMLSMIPVVTQPGVPAPVKDMFLRVLTPMERVVRRLMETASFDDPNIAVPELVSDLRELIGRLTPPEAEPTPPSTGEPETALQATQSGLV